MGFLKKKFDLNGFGHFFPFYVIAATRGGRSLSVVSSEQRIGVFTSTT